jgi:hypothetical protein
MNENQQKLNEWLETGKLSGKKRPLPPNNNIPRNARRTQKALPPAPKKPKQRNTPLSSNTLTVLPRPLPPPTAGEAARLQNGPPESPRPQHKSRSRVYTEQTKKKLSVILERLAEYVRNGRLSKKHYNHIYLYMIGKPPPEELLETLSPIMTPNNAKILENMYVDPNIQKVKRRLAPIFNYVKIQNQFMKGDVNSRRINISTDKKWAKFIQDLINELGVIPVNTNYTSNENDDEQPLDEVKKIVSNVIEGVIRQPTFDPNGVGGRRRRQTRRKRRN